MAKRTLRPQHTEECRAKIQTSQIINRLQNHLAGKVDLTDSQVRAAKVLLDKAMANPPSSHNLVGGLSVTIEGKFDV